MKLLIAGSRTIPEDRIDIINETTELLSIPAVQLLVSGRADGADKLGENWANIHSVEIKPFKPKYKDFPPAIAPLKRNEEMAIFCDFGIIIIDCQLWHKSRGTLNMMSFMEKYKKPYTLIGFDQMTQTYDYVDVKERAQLLLDYNSPI